MKKHITKQLQNNDIDVKIDRKIPKKTDKTLVFSVSITVAIAIFIVLFVTLINPVRALVRLDAAKSFFEGDKVSAVVINSASETEELLGDKEVILRDSDAEELSIRISQLLKNAKYLNTDKVNIGIWKTKIVMYNSTEQLELYVDNNGVYLENKGKLICYDFDGEWEKGYDTLLSDIEKLLQ